MFSYVNAELMLASASVFPPCPFTMHTPCAHDAERQIATTESAKAADPVLSVPLNPACSSLAEIAIVGATMNKSALIWESSSAWAITASIMIVSVSKGKCGPCCSNEPSGNNKTIEFVVFRCAVVISIVRWCCRRLKTITKMSNNFQR